MPQDTRFQTIGQGLGAGLQQVMDKRALATALTGIQQAPDRATAAQIVVNSMKGITDPTKQAVLLHALDIAKPQTDESPAEVTGYDPVTGREVKGYAKRSALPSLAANPDALAAVMGRAPGTVAMTKPVTHEYVSPDGRELGTFAEGMAPAGVMPKEDWLRQEKQ